MRIFHLAIQDLQQILRARGMIWFIILMPIVFTVFMGMIFAQPSESAALLQVAVLNNDPGGTLSTEFYSQLASAPELSLERVTPETATDAAERVREGKLAGMLIIPEGFSEKYLNGESTPLGFIVDANNSYGQAATQILRSNLYHYLGAVQTGIFTVQTIVPLKLLTKTEQQNVMNDAILTARRAYLNPPLLLEETGSKELAASTNPYTQSSPGIIIMFTFFSLISTASMLVIERTTGALARLMTTSLSRTEILLGHLLAMLTLVFMQQFLLVLFGQLVLNVNYFSQPLAVVLVIAFLSLWIASLGLLVGVFATTDDRAAVYTLIIMFIFTPLSGAWFPLEVAGKAFSIVGHLTPGAWAMDAYQNIVIRGLGLDSILLACLILLGYTLVTFLIAAWKFRRQSG